MLFDSMTDDEIEAAREERESGFSEKLTKWGAAEDGFPVLGGRVHCGPGSGA